MNFKHYFRGRGSTSFAKIDPYKRTYEAQPKIAGFYKKACNLVIAEVVIIQIKGSKNGQPLCSYHNQDRKVRSKHGGIKSPVFIGIMKYQSFICKFCDNFLSLHKTPKQKEEYLTVFMNT